MAVTIQFKRGKKEALEKILVGDNRPKNGEPILELSDNPTKPPRLKIGDGNLDYKNLPYFNEAGSVESSIVFGNHYEFPSVGQENVLYVAKDEKKNFIWDESSLRYVALVAEVNKIDGGGADSF